MPPTSQPRNASSDYPFHEHAQSWWDPKGPLALLHAINPIRIQWIHQTLLQHNPSASPRLHDYTVLDIGCGGGILCESLSRLGAKTTGIDIAPPLINAAKKHSLKANLNIAYLATSSENFAQSRPPPFDIITCFEVIEHHPHPQQLINACATLLKHNGILMLSTLNRTLASNLLAIHAAEKFLHFIPKGTHQWKNFIKPRELALLLNEASLTPFSSSGMTYNLPLRQFQLNPHNLSVNYFLSAVFLPSANKPAKRQ